jgi:uncharacterized Zn-binding protein involved in type VI secretion
MGKPAARLGDSTAHGGVITLGFPMVLIGGMPAARMGDMHVCPMATPATPPIPHVGGPIILGSPMVLIGGMPAARMGDMVTCVGPPDTIIMGCPTVLIGEGASGSAGGGGSVSSGAASAAAGAHNASSGSIESTTREEHWIEFEFTDNAGNPVSGVQYKFTGTSDEKSESVLKPDGRVIRDGIKEGDAKIEIFSISNAKWSKDKAEVDEKIDITAETKGFEDGTKAVIEIYKRDISGADSVVKNLESEIKGGKISASWEFKFPAGDQKKSSDYRVYSSPEYYFIIVCGRVTARSGLLGFKDWIEIELKDENNKPVANEEYLLYFSDGTVRKGKLNSSGYTKEEKIIPGKYEVKFPNIS